MTIDDMHRTLAQVVSEQMGRAILTGELPAGTRMVADDIQKNYGVSRTAIREALAILSSKGLLTSKPNVGIHISPSDRWHLLDTDVLRWAPADGWIAASARALHATLLADPATAAGYLAGDPFAMHLVNTLARFTPAPEDDGPAPAPQQKAVSWTS